MKVFPPLIDTETPLLVAAYIAPSEMMTDLTVLDPNPSAVVLAEPKLTPPFVEIYKPLFDPMTTKLPIAKTELTLTPARLFKKLLPPLVDMEIPLLVAA